VGHHRTLCSSVEQVASVVLRRKNPRLFLASCVLLNAVQALGACSSSDVVAHENK